MKPGRIALLVVGVLLALVALGVLAGGAALAVVASQRDTNGYFTSDRVEMSSGLNAITSQHVDLGGNPGDWIPSNFATVRIRSSSGRSVFIGVGPREDVARYLAGVAHDVLVDVGFAPFEPTYRPVAGSRTPRPPAEQSLWVARAAGSGAQTLTWPMERGDWTLVLMNADGSRGIDARIDVGVKSRFVVPVAAGLFVFGLLLGVGAAGMILAAVLGRRPSSEVEPAAAARARGAGTYPVLLEGRLDPSLSRWLWLVKWFLAIPHYVVLALLWVASVVLTLLAGLAILFTGRYPRSIFDFNVGVLRWTWRVTFYALALGTDRYPPFTLASDPWYPADLYVEYPERLSRGLVLVKTWLLAIPHYIVVGLFIGGGYAVARDAGPAGAGLGLIGVLVIVAAVSLAFTGRYLESAFDFVMGMYRWVCRVAAYAGLMRDEYPPFRLDMGGRDPGSVPAPSGPIPPPPVVSREPELAGRH